MVGAPLKQQLSPGVFDPDSREMSREKKEYKPVDLLTPPRRVETPGRNMIEIKKVK
jgi:hypothetical protein